MFAHDCKLKNIGLCVKSEGFLKKLNLKSGVEFSRGMLFKQFLFLNLLKKQSRESQWFN